MTKEIKHIPAGPELCQATIKMKYKLEANFLEFAKYLCHIHIRHLWDKQWDTFEDFLWEMHIERSQGFHYIEIYKLFADKVAPARLAKIGISKLIDVLPAVRKDPDRAMEFFEMAETMPRIDLRRTLHEEKCGVDMLKCEHKDTYLIRVCRDCGLRIKEFEEFEEVVESPLAIEASRV
jgi:hypothetical protein